MSLVTPKKEDVPATRRIGRADPAEIEAADLLRSDPGQSYRLFEMDSPTAAGAIANQIRKGQRSAFRDGFTAQSRTVNGKGVVYVTYVGDN